MARLGATRSFVDIYFGVAAKTFWYKDGLWMSNTFIPVVLVPTLQWSIAIGSVVVACLIGAWIYSLLRSGSILTLSSDSPLLLYATWTAFFVIVDVYLSNQLGLVGRYWIPVMVPTVALATVYVARAFPRARRQQVSLACATIWFVVSASLNGFSTDKYG